MKGSLKEEKGGAAKYITPHTEKRPAAQSIWSIYCKFNVKLEHILKFADQIAG